METPASIIEFVGISKRFGGVQALDDVSFSVARGEIHALVGENGAGKSTLIRICGGVYPPDNGNLRFDGAEAAFRSVEASRDAGISIVHQEIPVCTHLTATENIFLGRPLPKRGGLIDWREANRRAQALFDRLQVNVNPTQVVGRMPIAKQQLVAIAQALALDSKLLIMDEPTSALNREETRHLFDILRDLKSQGLTILYVSHKLEEVFEIADRITALRDGNYIGTIARDQATPDRVVNMMVGRDVTSLFPKTFQEPGKEPLLTATGLSVPGSFEDVSFDLFPGEVLGLVGLQGSGTSEVLRTLFGHLKPSAGEITLSGRKVRFASTTEAIQRRDRLCPRQPSGRGRVSIHVGARQQRPADAAPAGQPARVGITAPARSASARQCTGIRDSHCIHPFLDRQPFRRQPAEGRDRTHLIHGANGRAAR